MLGLLANARPNRVSANVQGRVPVVFPIPNDWRFGAFSEDPAAAPLLLVDEGGQHGEDLLHKLGQQNGGLEKQHQVNVIVHEDEVVDLYAVNCL